MRILGSLLSCLFIANIALAQPPVPGHVPGRLLVLHNGDPSSLAAARVFAGHGARLHARLARLGLSIIDVPPAQTDAIKESLSHNPLFRDVDYDYYAHQAAVPNDPQYSSQWHLAKIQAPNAWDMTTGSSAPIAIVDSGVDSTHPDLAARVIAGWNFVAGNSNTADVTGHGTAVAGAAAAATNNWIGVAGVTWQNPILPLVVSDSTGYATYSNMAAAIEYAADHGARVINISLGGSQPSSVLQSAVDYAWNEGALVVAAAMNDSSTTPMYPAACTNAVAVGATDQNDNLASFSDYGNWITVTAPGINILTTDNGGGYGYWYGTSLATPIVTGVAALALAADPALSAQALLSVIENTADKIGSSYYFGYGRVNAYRTVAAAYALAGGSSTTTSSSSSSTTSSGTGTTPTQSVPDTILVNAGGGAYTSSSGQTWSADMDYSGGWYYSTSSWINNTTDPTLYQTMRYGNSTYTFPVASGTYNVTLKFAELTQFYSGGRVFNVSLNGNTVLSNFDIYANAGALTAIDKTFTVSAGSQIVIQFSSVVGNPVVNAIAISPAGSSSTTTTATPPAAGSVLINAGGGTYTSSSGQTWSADMDYSGGWYYTTSSSINNTSDPTLYQTIRYGNSTYTVPVAAGTYNVTLKFAELTQFYSGGRVFNVSLNGNTVLSNFDIYANAGALTAIDKTFTVSTGSQIVIQFSSVVGNPIVNAIAISPASSSTSRSSALFRVNAGGGAYTSSSGQTWSADMDYSGGWYYTTSSWINNTTDPTLYQTMRYGNSTYTFPVASGTYNVTLKFAELTQFYTGGRVFNVSLNGNTVLSNFDIYANAGALTAIDKTFTVSAGGQIVIQFSGGVGNPVVNAIQIAPQ